VQLHRAVVVHLQPHQTLVQLHRAVVVHLQLHQTLVQLHRAVVVHLQPHQTLVQLHRAVVHFPPVLLIIVLGLFWQLVVLTVQPLFLMVQIRLPLVAKCPLLVHLPQQHSSNFK
jgi:hypothetical protein